MTTTTDFITGFSIEQSPKEVYDAINNVRGWWSENIEGSTDKLNVEWTYKQKDLHMCKMKIVEMIPEKRVVWLVMENHFSFTKDKSDVKGSGLGLSISKRIVEKHNGRIWIESKIGEGTTFYFTIPKKEK